MQQNVSLKSINDKSFWLLPPQWTDLHVFSMYALPGIILEAGPADIWRTDSRYLSRRAF